MLRTIILTLALGAAPAAALDFDQAVSKLQNAEFTCTTGQNHDGAAVAEHVQAQACFDAEKAAKELTAAGYCYSTASHEWGTC